MIAGRATALRLWVYAVGLAAVSGCYRYADVPIAQLQPGMDVRARLTASAVDRLARDSRAEARMLNGFTISGTVEQVGADSVLLAVPTALLEGDFRATVLTQDIALPRTDFVRAETQRLDKWKTGLILGGVGAGALAIIINSRRGSGHSGGIPVIGGPPENRVPVGLTWRFP